MSWARSPRAAVPTSWPRWPRSDRADDRRAPPPRRPDRVRSSPRLAAPGLHLIAEIKRASPSAGRIAAAGDDIVARARAYEAGGAAAISVLCEPHWFGGSVDDLRAVRAAVAIPVLAKDFVVEEVQLPVLRAAGADLVLLLAVLHPAKRLARARRARPGPRSRAARRGPRRAGARSRARDGRPVDRAQQPRPADARRRRRPRGPAPRARAGRPPRHRGVGRTRARDRGALAGARVRRGARRRGAGPGRRTRPRPPGPSSPPARPRPTRPTSPAARS